MQGIKPKRMAFRSCQTQEQGLASPASPMPMIEPLNLSLNSLAQGVNGNNSQGLLNLIHFANVLQIFKKSVDRFKGTNVPVSYRPSYQFSEKWQQSHKVKFQSNDVVYLAANSFCLTIAVLVLIHKIPLIWYMSVYQIFGFQKLISWWVTSLLMIFVDVFLKIFLIHVEMTKVTQKSQAYKKQFKFNLLSMFSLDLITILVILSELIFSIDSPYGIIIDFTVIFIQTKRFNEIYNSLTIILIGNKYKNYVNLFGFISKLFTALHIFTILVYGVTLLSPNVNWLQNIGKQNQDAMTRYIYSLYFTGTTMFTVGYGDIIPKTNIEIVVIIFIQVVGIVLIGYIVSQIGHTLSVMRQARQDFQNDIQNADTICHHYNLDDGLKNRVRNYIVNHRLANEQLNTNEQNNILMKLNQELRNQVKYVNHLNIIKTSLFFICHWSKKMQNDLSKKLQKFIFSPNQPITKQDKLYIVTRGNIDVYTQRKIGNKIYCKKHLKSIEKKINNEVHSNVYGYTTLFTGKVNKLTAISKDFAICYALQYSDILESMKDDDRDFQSYHQIKSKLQLQKFPQSYEIPRLINNRQHYCPTKAIVLRRYKRQCSQIQQRQYRFRQYVKRKFVFFQQKDQFEDSDSEVLVSDQDNVSDSNYNKLDQNEKIGQVSLQRMLQQNKKNALKSFISFRSYRRRFYSKIEDEKMKYDEVKKIIQTQVIATSLFEVTKNFIKYYKKGNCSNVLIQLNKNTIKDFTQINSKNMSLDWINLLVFKSKVNNSSIKSPSLTSKFF